VKDIVTWNASECTLLYYDDVYKDYTHILYYYYVCLLFSPLPSTLVYILIKNKFFAGKNSE
jgi:hypothetical protein